MSATIEVYIGSQHFMYDNWCARCVACGVALTKFCDTEEDARREGDDAAKDHSCARRHGERP